MDIKGLSIILGAGPTLRTLITGLLNLVGLSRLTAGLSNAYEMSDD